MVRPVRARNGCILFSFRRRARKCNRPELPVVIPIARHKTCKEVVMPANFPMFFFLGIGALSFFSFLAVATWVGTRLQERQAFYESETLKKIAETQAGGANPAMEYLREKERLARAKQREGLKLGGLVNIAVGLGLLVFLVTYPETRHVYLVSLIPLFIGVALLAYPFFFSPKD
jgi:hypothetical protein